MTSNGATPPEHHEAQHEPPYTNCHPHEWMILRFDFFIEIAPDAESINETEAKRPIFNHRAVAADTCFLGARTNETLIRAINRVNVLYAFIISAEQNRRVVPFRDIVVVGLEVQHFAEGNFRLSIRA